MNFEPLTDKENTLLYSIPPPDHNDLALTGKYRGLKTYKQIWDEDNKYAYWVLGLKYGELKGFGMRLMHRYFVHRVTSFNPEDPIDE